MSKCISQHGEYSDHEPSAADVYTCRLCGAYDDDRMHADLASQASALANWKAVAFGYQAKIEEQAATIQERDAALNQVMEERDHAEDWADKLAYFIAPIAVIGEHSSGNNPWQNALDGGRP